MQPRRSDRIRKMNAITATSSTDTASESIHKATKKRRRTKTEADTEWTAANSPKRKKSKLDIDVKLEVPVIENECPINGLVKIDNLEHFPEEILLEIFERTDDVGLVNLAETSYRFAAIAQFTFKERYANRYFVINSENRGGDPELYWAQLNRFGNSIKAIQLNGVGNQYQSIVDHWAAKMLQQHISHIKKLTFNECDFNKNEQSELFLQQLAEITHLVYNKCYNMVDLPNCHKLEKLELREAYGSVSYSSLEQIMQNNPSLQSLLLYDCFGDELNLCQFIALIADNSNHIKELTLVDGSLKNELVDGSWKTPEEIDTIVDSFQHLESLALTIESNFIGLLRRLVTECRSIKHLELHRVENYDEISVAARSFQQIESLHLTSFDEENLVAKIGSIIEHLPNLRHLITTECYVRETSIELFRKCPSLEKITITMDYSYDAEMCMNTLLSVEYFEKFIGTIISIGKPKSRVEVQEKGEIIGSLTENGLVWRNKLLHWTGCDKNESISDIHLLDLVKYPVESDAEPQRNTLDLIFDYLDMSSLKAIGEISTKSMTLVESYIEKHAKQHRTFNITDEFDHGFGLIKTKRAKQTFDMDVFARRVTELHVDYFDRNNLPAELNRYELLNRLTIHCKSRGWFHPRHIKLRQVRHFILHSQPDSSGFSALARILNYCPNIEIIEFRNAGIFGDLAYTRFSSLKFGSFKKFIFNYRGKSQLNNLKEFFKNTNTQLIPIF